MFKTASLATLALVLSTAVAAGMTLSPLCKLPKYCTPEEVIKCMRDTSFTQSYYKSVIDNMVTLLTPYAFTEILKNPPQPEGHPDYFTPVDLIGDLKSVDTNPASFYDFYRSVKRVLNSAQDGHLVYFFTGSESYDHKLIDFYSMLPLTLHTTNGADGKARMLGKPVNASLYEHFKNGAEIQEIVESNADVSIKSINGMSPFDFVLSFGSEYYNFLKNRDAKYTYAAYYFQRLLPLYDFPLEVGDFTNVKIVYENGVTFTTDFLFRNADPDPDVTRSVSTTTTTITTTTTTTTTTSTSSSSNSNNKKKVRFTEYVRERVRSSSTGSSSSSGLMQLDLNRLLEEWEKSGEGAEKVQQRRPLTEQEVLEQLKNVDVKKLVRRHRRQQQQQQRGAGAVRRGTSLWDRSTADGVLKCKVDKGNKVNVFFTNSFAPEDALEYVDVLVKCVEDFDSNSYPIIVIDDMNTGGAIVLAYLFQEVLQHDMVARSYVAYKDDAKLRDAMGELSFYSSIQHPDTCEAYVSAYELFMDTETDDFGNETHTRTPPVFLVQVEASLLRLDMEDVYGAARRPTEIVVFTDSFSFSAGAMLTKGLREAGAAIIAGYGGYPGSPRETFDIGQSPTNCLQAGIESLDSPAYDRLSEKGVIYASVSIGESFRVRDVELRGSGSDAPLVPREFLFDAPDERAAIYGAYDDTRYDEFVAAGKAILEKYKTECNPENARLHMRSASCDSAIGKEHMHGGFTCGSDGKWSAKCEGYYCDSGFVYDARTDSCVEDKCYEEAKLLEDIISLAIGIIIAIVVACLVFVLLVVICCVVVCCVVASH